jgi:hypothetical protein
VSSSSILALRSFLFADFHLSVSSGASALKNAGKEQGHETKGDSHNPLN